MRKAPLKSGAFCLPPPRRARPHPFAIPAAGRYCRAPCYRAPGL